jgi:hypothetical protein
MNKSGNGVAGRARGGIMTKVEWQTAVENKRADLRELVAQIETCASVGTFAAASIGAVRTTNLVQTNVHEGLADLLRDEALRVVGLRAAERATRAELGLLIKVQP